MQVNRSLYPVGNNFSSIARMQDNFAKLQLQLATGEKASSLSELGRERTLDLDLRARLGVMDSYTSNIETVELRLSFMQNAVTRLDEIEGESRAAVMTGGTGFEEASMVSVPKLAENRLEEVLSILNGDLNGRYVFGGSTTDAPPVASYDLIMNGDGTRDGFRTIAAQRKAADAGADAKGRLVTDQPLLTSAIPGGSPDTVTLTEADPIASPVRTQLTGVSTTSANVAVTAPAGSPVELAVQFTGLPADGETITIDVTLADGTVDSRIFTAVTGTPANPGEFQIGADANETATNFQAALDSYLTSDTVVLSEDGVHDFGLKLIDGSVDSDGASISAAAGSPAVATISLTEDFEVGDSISYRFELPDGSLETIKLRAVSTVPTELPGDFNIGASLSETTQNMKTALDGAIQELVGTKLEAVSVYEAADDFFAGRNGTAQRVDGPPYETATAMIAATDADTVDWYTGEDTTGVPRETVTAKVDTSTSVRYGVQANEKGIVDLISSLAALTIDDYPASDPYSKDKFIAMADKQLSRLAETNNDDPGAIEVISLDLGIAQVTANSASERHQTYSAQLESMLAEVEEAPLEETAAKLLQLQVRLEASYQTTSIVSELTLVNFMR